MTAAAAAQATLWIPFLRADGAGDKGLPVYTADEIRKHCTQETRIWVRDARLPYFAPRSGSACRLGVIREPHAFMYTLCRRRRMVIKFMTLQTL